MNVDNEYVGVVHSYPINAFTHQKETSMAILQSRMIALINAALDYQQGLRELQKLIREGITKIQSMEHEEIAEQALTARTLLMNLALRANDINLLEDPARSQATITGEHYRYTMNKKRNELNRKYQEKRRGGITTKHHLEPDYATEEFNMTAMKKIPFRGEKQNQKGFTIPSIEYIPGELSAERKAQIDREIERNFNPNTDIIPKGKDPFEPEEEE